MKGSRPLSAMEISKLQEAADPRLRALVSVLCFTGARMSEALGLTWSDVLDFKTWQPRDVITLRRATTKGQREGRQIPVPPKLSRELTRYLRAQEELAFPSRPLFAWSRSAATRAFEQLGGSIGLVGVSSHGCRKWYASELLRRGARMRDVQELLGHADLRTTSAYIGTPTAEDLRETVDRLPDGGP